MCYTKSRFFVVPGEGPSLLGMPDIKLLNIWKMTYEVIGSPHESRKLDLQTMEESNSPGCRKN